MFEFYLKYGDNSEFTDPYISDGPFLKGVKFQKNRYSFGALNIVTLSHQEEDTFKYETEDYVLFLKGHVFYRKAYSAVSENKLSPEKLFKLIRSDKGFYKVIKGEFNIILFNKNTGLFRLYTDHFSLLPTYYAKINGDIIVTNNLNQFKFFNLPVDHVVYLEQLLFGYPIMKNTIFKGVKLLAEGSLLEAKGEEQSINSVFRLSELVYREDLHRFDLAEFQSILNYVALQKTELGSQNSLFLEESVLSRISLSGLLKKKANFEVIKKESVASDLENLIPIEKLKKTTDISKNDYFSSTIEALYFSEGIQGLGAYEKNALLHQFCDGGENILSDLSAEVFLLPLSKKNKFFTEDYFEIIYQKSNFNLNEIFLKRGWNKLIDQALIDNHTILFHERIQEKRKEIAGKRLGEEGFLFYVYDLLKLILKRTHGNQVHANRHIIVESPVFWDIDVLQYLIRSQHNLVFKESFADKAKKKTKPYVLVAKLIQNNLPEFNRVICSEGFIPNNLLSSFKRHFGVKLKKNELNYLLPSKYQSLIKSELMEIDTTPSKLFNQSEIEEILSSDSLITKDLEKVLSMYIWLTIL